MKLRPFPNRKSRKPRKPMKTFTEMAEEFGITAAQLNFALRSDPGHPSGSPRGQNKRERWYDTDEMRNWWKKRNQGEIK